MAPLLDWLAEGVRLAAETAHESPLAASIATGREFSNLIWGCHGDEGGFLAVLPRLRPVWMTPGAISPTSAVATIGCSFLCVVQRGPLDINRIYRQNRQGAAGTQTFGWGARTPILSTRRYRAWSLDFILSRPRSAIPILKDGLD